MEWSDPASWNDGRLPGENDMVEHNCTPKCYISITRETFVLYLNSKRIICFI